MTTDPERLLSITNHPNYSMAVPTPEHFLPLVYLAGLSAAAGQPSQVLVEGGAMGSLTMTSFVLGGGAIPKPQTDEAAASMPDPADILPEHTKSRRLPWQSIRPEGPFDFCFVFHRVLELSG